MINNTTVCLQKKREQFALNMKRIDRETLFASNRQKMIQHNLELDKILHQLNGAITIYNKKDIKNYLKQLIEFTNYTYQQEEKLIQLLNQLLNLKVEDDNSTLHNESLNILVKLSLSNQSTNTLFNQLSIMCKLIEKYNNHINQSLSYQILDKILAFIGNVSQNNGFIDYFTTQLIDILIYQIVYGQKRLIIQSIWTINNILYAFHNEIKQLNEILIQIAKSELPQYLIQYTKKNENKFEKNQLVQIYWFYAELSTTIPYDIAELSLQNLENNDLQLIILYIYANLTAQKIIPKYCDVQYLFKLFTTKQPIFQRQILVIVANLVLLQQIDQDALRNLINYAFPLCPIDTMVLLHNCQITYNFQLNEQEKEMISRIIQEIQSDPVVEDFIQQLKLNY